MRLRAMEIRRPPVVVLALQHTGKRNLNSKCRSSSCKNETKVFRKSEEYLFFIWLVTFLLLHFHFYSFSFVSFSFIFSYFSFTLFPLFFSLSFPF